MSSTFERARKALHSLSNRFTRDASFVLGGIGQDELLGHYIKLIFKGVPRRQVPKKHNGVPVKVVVDTQTNGVAP